MRDYVETLTKRKATYCYMAAWSPNYVNEFKYLGHVVSNSQLDDADIHRERKNLFYRCNMLTRRFSKC